MQYVAFLRAINTGKRRIKMADLREVYVNCGYLDAETYIATGNVIFTSDDQPDVSVLEEAFSTRFGFASEVFLRKMSDLGRLVAGLPWGEADGLIEISFLEAVPDGESARKLEATAVSPEELVVSGTEVLFLRAGKGIETTHKEQTAMRILDMKMTRRGIGTIRQICDRFSRESVGGGDS